jgi:hypothetical protein
MAVWLETVGVTAPGLAGWARARAVLAGTEPYRAEPLAAPRTTLLRANEHRRTTPLIRLALQTAEDALRDTPIRAEQLCSVFACSTGDMEIVHSICHALTLPERPVSPTQFHNSVHNAPAGYWSVATAASRPSISIAAYDQSFAAGLLEAWTMVEVEREPVLLVAYEWPPPPSLQPHRPLSNAFAAALILSERPRADSRFRVELQIEPGTASTLSDPGLEALRRSNPAARSLPLLAAIAAEQPTQVHLPYSPLGVLTVRCCQP